MVSSAEPQPVRESKAPIAIGQRAIPWSGHIRSGKLHRPELPVGMVSRARILDLFDAGDAPLILVAAPAGFGKTIAATEWALLDPEASWLTVDSSDTSLQCFWGHLHAALKQRSSGVGDLVKEAFSGPLRTSPIDLGRILADEILDASQPVRIVLDDLHRATSPDIVAFLSGLLEVPPGALRLLITTRVEPPLPLSRMRIRGTVREIHADDLLFTQEEIQEFQSEAVAGMPGTNPVENARALMRRSRGWAAGLRLLQAGGLNGKSLSAAAGTAHFDSGLASVMLEETWAEWTPDQRQILIAAALPERFSFRLVSVLTGAPDDVVSTVIDFARNAALCRTAVHAEDDWLEFHALFREALLQQLKDSVPRRALEEMHQRAARWFEEAGVIEPAIDHWLGAGEFDAAARLVERQLQSALAREDWPTMAHYLDRLPDTLVGQRPQLMMGRAWIAHVRGRYGQKRQIARNLSDQLADLPPESPARRALAAELDVLLLENVAAVHARPDLALVHAHRAIEALPHERRFALGIATLMVAAAQQCLGELDAAEETLHGLFNQASHGLDAASIRGLFGLCLLALQEGDLARTQAYARSLMEIAAEQGLRLMEGWGRALLADALYDRNELEQSIGLNTLVARDHDHCHFFCLLESQFTLAQAYLAAGRAHDARRTRQETLDIITLEKAAAQIPYFQAHEAYISLLLGDVDDALTWAHANHSAVAVTSMHAMLNPVLIRALIFGAGGNAQQREEAATALVEFRAHVVRTHFVRPLVRLDAIAAIIHFKQGHRRNADAALRQSLSVGLPRGFTRAYLDLLRLFPVEMAELLSRVELPSTFRALLDREQFAITHHQGLNDQFNPLVTLTDRERQILAALDRRFTYDEIGDQLYISPHTVKRHACNIYTKLGVSGRNAALRTARDLGWRPEFAAP